MIQKVVLAGLSYVFVDMLTVRPRSNENLLNYIFRVYQKMFSLETQQLLVSERSDQYRPLTEVPQETSDRILWSTID